MWRVLKRSLLCFLSALFQVVRGGKVSLIGRLSQARAFSGWDGGRRGMDTIGGGSWGGR